MALVQLTQNVLTLPMYRTNDTMNLHTRQHDKRTIFNTSVCVFVNKGLFLKFLKKQPNVVNIQLIIFERVFLLPSGKKRNRFAGNRSQNIHFP